MGVRLANLFGALALTTTLGLWANAANAQERPSRQLVPPTVNEAFEDAFFGANGTFYQNRGFLRTLSVIFGPFPENNAITDARNVNRTLNSALAQQAAGPILRTPDLENPFSTSLLLSPDLGLQGASSATPAEVQFVPPLVPSFAPTPPPVQQQAPARPAGPVRALY
ncbi:MAG TPA: hypothetical protein IGS37_13265 [Synechococcales cyanobacterium M55_K2018_004]|nr:hypothetical protein [Synechococcales cyanobacterium M55_K2018_004]